WLRASKSRRLHNNRTASFHRIRNCRSSPTSQCDLQRSPLREVGVVVELRNFQRPEFQNAFVELAVIAFAEAFELRYLHALDARHGQRRTHQLAQINSLAEREIVRIEETKLAILLHAVA